MIAAFLALALLSGAHARQSLPDLEAKIQEETQAGAFPEVLEKLNRQADALVAKSRRDAERKIARDRAAQAVFFGEAQRLRGLAGATRDPDQRQLALKKTQAQLASAEARIAYWDGVEAGYEKGLRGLLDRLEPYSGEAALERKEKLWGSRARVRELCKGARKAAEKEREILRDVERALSGPVETGP
jgi:hypothetical protein